MLVSKTLASTKACSRMYLTENEMSLFESELYGCAPTDKGLLGCMQLKRNAKRTKL